MRTIKVLAFLTAIVALITAIIVLITELVECCIVVPVPTLSFYTLRIELSTTSEWSVLNILDTSTILDAHLINKHGNLTYFEAGKETLTINQSFEDSESLHEISLIMDFDISSNAIDKSIPFLLKKGANNNSTVLFYSVVNGKETLLREVLREGSVPGNPGLNPFEFSFDLKTLK